MRKQYRPDLKVLLSTAALCATAINPLAAAQKSSKQQEPKHNNSSCAKCGTN